MRFNINMHCKTKLDKIDFIISILHIFKIIYDMVLKLKGWCSPKLCLLVFAQKCFINSIIMITYIRSSMFSILKVCLHNLSIKKNTYTIKIIEFKKEHILGEIT